MSWFTRLSDRLWRAFGRWYLRDRYNAGKHALAIALIEDPAVKTISTAEAEKYAEEEYTLGLVTKEDREGQWWHMPGGIGRIETLDEYAGRWVEWKKAPDRKTKKRRWFWQKKRRWFWQVPQHMPKMYYRPKYHEPIFQQINILSDAVVYNHAKAAGVDVSKYFVTSGGTGKNDPLNVVCTAVRWKDQYVEERMRDVDPDREEDHAAA